MLLWDGKRAGVVDGASIEGAGSVEGAGAGAWVRLGREGWAVTKVSLAGAAAWQGWVVGVAGVVASDVKAEPRETWGCCGVESWRRRVGGRLAPRRTKIPENKNRARRRGYSQSEKIKTPSPPKAKFELSRSSEIKNQHCLV